MGDNGIRRERIHSEGGGEGFSPGLEPFVEHQRLEHCSREILEKESRIGFTRPKPFAQERKLELAGRGEAARGRLIGLVTGRRASRNLLLHEKRRRDVLKIQRTALARQRREMRAG